jgi:hypothetical protein
MSHHNQESIMILQVPLLDTAYALIKPEEWAAISQIADSDLRDQLVIVAVWDEFSAEWLQAKYN